jgi:uncharacterized protein YjbI with pentapeptide repeats
MDRFIINVYDSIDTLFNAEDVNKLEDFLEENISKFKNLSKYDNFIVDFPSVQIQIDQNNNYDMVNTYYDKIYPKLFSIVEATDDLKECIINYVINTQIVEIVDANFKSLLTIRGCDLINCQVEGIFEDCFFVGSEIKNSQLVKSKIQHSDVDNSKVLSCKVEQSELVNCYFMNGYLNGDMTGGVFRSGELGPYANLDSDVKVVTDTSNFFDTPFEEDIKGDKQGAIKGFKK